MCNDKDPGRQSRALNNNAVAFAIGKGVLAVVLKNLGRDKTDTGWPLEAHSNSRKIVCELEYVKEKQILNLKF